MDRLRAVSLAKKSVKECKTSGCTSVTGVHDVWGMNSLWLCSSHSHVDWAFFLFACLTMLLAACNAPLAVTLARSLVLCSSPLISSRRETACSLACTLMTAHLCCILLCVLPYGIVSKERCGGLMVSALDTWSSSLNSRHCLEHCTVFFGKTFTLTVPLLTQAHRVVIGLSNSCLATSFSPVDVFYTSW